MISARTPRAGLPTPAMCVKCTSRVLVQAMSNLSDRHPDAFGSQKYVYHKLASCQQELVAEA